MVFLIIEGGKQVCFEYSKHTCFPPKSIQINIVIPNEVRDLIYRDIQ